MDEQAHRRSATAAVQQETPPPPSNLPTLRAAYSDRSAALMAYLSAFAYHPAVGPQMGSPTGRGQVPESQIPPELASLGFKSFSTYANGLTDGYAFVAETDALSVLSFRGTQSKKNWKTDFLAELIRPLPENSLLRVHKGFHSAFEGLYRDGLAQRVSSILGINDNRPLYITGHSLGGALAQIAAAVFASDKVAACYTFGSPRVGNAYFDLWVKPPSYRVINHADLVPQIPIWLPTFPYRHAGDPRYLPSQVGGSVYRYQPSLYVRFGQFIQGIISFAKNGSFLGADEHAIGLYCKKLDAIARTRTQGR